MNKTLQVIGAVLATAVVIGLAWWLIAATLNPPVGPL